MPHRVGVQGQVFTVVNSDAPEHQYDDLMAGAWMDATNGKWDDVAIYVGSTTGTSRSDETCSMYAPITWQMDRKCHIISAKSFDNMCKQMLENSAVKGGDDMHADVHPHGAREVTDNAISSTMVYDDSF